MNGHLGQRDGVEQQRIGPDRKSSRGEGTGQQSGLEDVDAIDQLRPHEGDRPGQGVLPDLDGEPAPLLRLEQLGVAQAARTPVGREYHRRRGDRPGQTAAAYFIDPGDVAVSAGPEDPLLGEIGVQAGMMPERDLDPAVGGT